MCISESYSLKVKRPNNPLPSKIHKRKMKHRPYPPNELITSDQEASDKYLKIAPQNRTESNL